MNTLQPTLPPIRRGRRSVQTPERAKVICDAVERGVPFVHACAAAGISFQTFADWRRRDASLREALDSAIARGVEKRLRKIEQAADAGDWRAAAWLLEHCQPEHFAKSRIQVEALGQLEHSFAIPPQVLTEIAEARMRLEQKQHEPKQIETGGT